MGGILGVMFSVPLRRALVVVSRVLPELPYWARLEQPACLRSLDLKFPCTEADVLAAYRERAKSLHPDRGGDLQQFLRLQKNLEQALEFVRGRERRGSAAATTPSDNPD